MEFIRNPSNSNTTSTCTDLCYACIGFCHSNIRDHCLYFDAYTNNLSVNPQYTIHNCPKLDILIVPGGQGTRNEMNNEIILDWIKSINPDLELLLTVCTGALIIAKCGLLNGLTATTHHLSLDLLKEIAPDTNIVSGERYIDNGKIILSGGISAGIDMSLYVVEKLLGKEAAVKTTDIMEYDW